MWFQSTLFYGCDFYRYFSIDVISVDTLLWLWFYRLLTWFQSTLFYWCNLNRRSPIGEISIDFDYYTLSQFHANHNGRRRKENHTKNETKEAMSHPRPATHHLNTNEENDSESSSPARNPTEQTNANGPSLLWASPNQRNLWSPRLLLRTNNFLPVRIFVV